MNTVSDFFYAAADTVPIWTRGAVALLVVVIIGLVLYAAGQRQPWD